MAAIYFRCHRIGEDGQPEPFGMKLEVEGATLKCSYEELMEKMSKPGAKTELLKAVPSGIFDVFGIDPEETEVITEEEYISSGLSTD